MFDTVTTYRDFESREHLTRYVEDRVRSALAKFSKHDGTRVEVTLLRDRAVPGKPYQVGVSLKPQHAAPLHIIKQADDVHAAIRDAVKTVEVMMRRESSKRLSRRRRNGRLSELGRIA